MYCTCMYFVVFNFVICFLYIFLNFVFILTGFFSISCMFCVKTFPKYMYNYIGVCPEQSVQVMCCYFCFCYVSVTVDAVAVVDWERVDGSGPLRPPSLLVSLVLCLVIAVCYVYPIVLQFVYSLFTFYLDVSLLL